MTGRIVRSADFERVLGTPSRARSPHFAVHHLAASPSQPARRRPASDVAPTAGSSPETSAQVSTEASTGLTDLSTGDAQIHPQLVDEAALSTPTAAWLGYVVPKRHAKRAVTRTLLKRQIRQVFGTLPSLPPGLWVVRLRMPFDKKQFPSASSDALRTAAREELQFLIRKVAGAGKPAAAVSAPAASAPAPAPVSATASASSAASSATQASDATVHPASRVS